MSLATRCTSCGTVFRVVQDQLKVSEGWVRCGRCDSVFNALEGLFDLERDQPPEWSGTAPAPGPTGGVDLRIDEPGDPGQDRAPDPSLVERIDEQLLGGRRSAFGALAQLGRNDRGADFADARFDSVPPGEAADLVWHDEAAAPAAASAPADVAQPSFVQEAERRGRWESSGVRKGLVAAAGLLCLLLLGQVVHLRRDEAAAAWPVAAPALHRWCDWLGCTVSAPRRLDDLVVESTSLSRGSTSENFRLTVVLRNRGGVAVALPSIELSLTDPNGDLVARRALTSLELRAAGPSAPAGSETTLSALLSVGAARVTGYTVELFYP